MRKKYFKITYYLLLVTFPLIISAYTFLQPLPGLENQPGESLLAKYLSWLFRFALAAAAFLAVLQITIAGIQMIFGGASETARTNAKARISDAVWGLVLALGSVLILTTISPQFKDMKLTIPEIKVAVKKESGKGKICCIVTLINKEGKEIQIQQGGLPYELDPQFKSNSKEAIMEECKKMCKKNEGFISAVCGETCLE